MSYIINNSRGNIVAVVAPGTVNTTATPISLVGQGVTDYGTAENQNYVWILENFCNTTAPTAPLLGQLWYNNSTDTLSVYTTANTWIAMATENFVEEQKNSPVFTGTPTAPTAADGTNTTQIATTRFVGNAVANFALSAANTYAPLISAALTGVPTAPTAAAVTDSTQIATTAFVQAQKINPTFTGSVSVTANVTAANFFGNVISPTGSPVTTTGNITGGNISTSGEISAAGNIVTPSNYLGGNVITSGFVSATGNVRTNNQVSATGNIIGGNLLTAGSISATGNITSSAIIIADTVIANTITTTGTSSAFRLPNLTQAQINALTPQNGDMVYNVTTDYPQVYQNGSWRIFTLAYYS